MTRTRTAKRGAGAARGFTLLEVIIVIAIILAIASLVTVNLMSAKGKADKDTVAIQLGHIKEAVKMFMIDFNRYPTDDEGLEVLWSKQKLDSTADATKWHEYMENNPTDRWGTPWNYKQVGEKAPEGMFDLFSSGPDKEAGTDDDINAWPKSAEPGTDSGPSGPEPSPPRSSSGSGGRP